MQRPVAVNHVYKQSSGPVNRDRVAAGAPITQSHSLYSAFVPPDPLAHHSSNSRIRVVTNNSEIQRMPDRVNARRREPVKPPQPGEDHLRVGGGAGDQSDIASQASRISGKSIRSCSVRSSTPVRRKKISQAKFNSNKLKLLMDTQKKPIQEGDQGN